MATPVTTGTAAMIIEYFRDGQWHALRFTCLLSVRRHASNRAANK
jgi:hypothetical protein